METIKKILKAIFAPDGRVIMILEILTLIILALGFFTMIKE